ncbi:MAG: DUF1684 domain-containing protein [Bacteroidales bacterium]|nr:DUF1684 domain-containing protein [Bacteroidales bacterium]
MYKFISNFLVLVLFISLFSCQSNKEPFNEEEYVQSVQEWQIKRLESLKSENGWLNLVGLHWLKDGQNPFGSNEANNIIFPENAPGFIGNIILYKGNLSISINEDVEVFINDSLLKESDILTDAEKGTTKFKMGSFRWYIIKRGDRYGIRLKDLESPLIDQITKVPSFPIDSKWRLKAKFEKFDTPKEIAVPNVLGDTEYEKCYGLIKFKIGDEEHSLMPLGDGNKGFFVIFADETSAEETYGAGRFLSVDKPDEKGNTFVDFNKATNPPCAFTDYATCPLPPRENILSVKILAGEKVNEHFGHH